MEPTPKYCGSCGAPITADLRYCEQCGKPVRTSAPMDQQAGPRATDSVPLGMKATLPISAQLGQEASLAGVASPESPRPPSGPMAAQAPSGSMAGQSPSGSMPARPPSGPMPQVVQPATKTRLWPLLLIVFLLSLVGTGFVAWYGFPLESRGLLAGRGLRTMNEKSRVGAFPLDADGTLPSFIRRRTAPEARPPGAQLVTPAYDIRADGPAEPPFEVSLPLLHESAVEEGRHIVMGRYTGEHWEPLPTEAIEDRVWAVSDTLGMFAAWSLPVTRAADQAQLTVRAPALMYGRVRGEHISVHLDLRGLDVAHDPSEPWRRRSEVRSLRVEVARPEDGDGFRPYEVSGSQLEWQTTERVGVLPIAVAPLPRSLDHSRAVGQDAWSVRVVPVFADGTVGSPTESVTVYPLALRTLVWLRRNLPFEGAQRTAFLRATQDHPLGVVFSDYLENAYNGSIGWSHNRLWGRRRAAIRHAHIGLRVDAPYGDVLTHEWGHYAVHMAFGEDYYAAHPGHEPSLGRESTRAGAFAEDLATLLGQLGTGRGLPAAAGAMHGRLEDYSRHLPGRPTADRWPLHRDVDAASVEGVPATVMSRVAARIGAERLLAGLADHRPTDLIALYDALEANHHEAMQPIFADEGVSFLVRGRVLSGDGPVAGALVRVRTLGGTAVPAAREDARGLVTVSDPEGGFSVRVPPGEVRLTAERSGFTQDAPVSFTAATDGPTNGPPQALREPIQLHR